MTIIMVSELHNNSGISSHDLANVSEDFSNNIMSKKSVKGRQIKEARAKIANAENILLDWDGCVATENQPFENAVKFLRNLKKPYVIISNNTTKMPKDFAKILNAQGLKVNEGQIITAGCETINYAYENGFRKVEILGSYKLILYAKRRGLEIASKDPDAIILLRDVRFNYVKLCDVVNKIKCHIPLIVGNADLTHPGKNGKIVPETGALYAAIDACLDIDGRKSVIFVGKPFARLFQCAAKRFNLDLKKTVLIGDNPETDIKGAHAVGAQAILVNGDSGINFADLL